LSAPAGPYFNTRHKNKHQAKSGRSSKGETWRGCAMLTPEERDLLTDIQDRLLELYVQREHVNRTADWAQLPAVNREIAVVEAQREELRRWEMAGTA
jgi:hypothetical protein